MQKEREDRIHMIDELLHNTHCNTIRILLYRSLLFLTKNWARYTCIAYTFCMILRLF